MCNKHPLVEINKKMKNCEKREERYFGKSLSITKKRGKILEKWLERFDAGILEFQCVLIVNFVMRNRDDIFVNVTFNKCIKKIEENQNNSIFQFYFGCHVTAFVKIQFQINNAHFFGIFRALKAFEYRRHEVGCKWWRVLSVQVFFTLYVFTMRKLLFSIWKSHPLPAYFSLFRCVFYVDCEEECLWNVQQWGSRQFHGTQQSPGEFVAAAGETKLHFPGKTSENWLKSNLFQAKIAALKELVRQSEVAQGKKAAHAKEKVKNIAQRLSHLKSKATNSSQGTVSSIAFLLACTANPKRFNY